MPHFAHLWISHSDSESSCRLRDVKGGTSGIVMRGELDAKKSRMSRHRSKERTSFRLDSIPKQAEAALAPVSRVAVARGLFLA